MNQKTKFLIHSLFIFIILFIIMSLPEFLGLFNSAKVEIKTNILFALIPSALLYALNIKYRKPSELEYQYKDEEHKKKIIDKILAFSIDQWKKEVVYSDDYSIHLTGRNFYNKWLYRPVIINIEDTKLTIHLQECDKNLIKRGLSWR